jgi:hypothetical protein
MNEMVTWEGRVTQGLGTYGRVPSLQISSEQGASRQNFICQDSVILLRNLCSCRDITSDVYALRQTTLEQLSVRFSTKVNV